MSEDEKTLSDAVRELEEAGYTDALRAEGNGLRATKADLLLLPEKLVADEVYRFEGSTNPADQSILFGVRCTQTGVRGTYVAAYGPQMDPRDAEMVRRLSSTD